MHGTPISISLERITIGDQDARIARSAAQQEPESAPAPGRSSKESAAERIMKNPAVKSFLRSAATVAGREISRSIFGTRKR